MIRLIMRLIVGLIVKFMVGLQASALLAGAHCELVRTHHTSADGLPRLQGGAVPWRRRRRVASTALPFSLAGEIQWGLASSRRRLLTRRVVGGRLVGRTADGVSMGESDGWRATASGSIVPRICEVHAMWVRREWVGARCGSGAIWVGRGRSYNGLQGPSRLL